MLADWISATPDDVPARRPSAFRARVSYAELSAHGRAHCLGAGGIRRQARRLRAFLGFNSPEMLALLFACAKLGALFMPLNWRLAAPEHKQMLLDCPPRVLIVESDFLAQTRHPSMNAGRDPTWSAFGSRPHPAGHPGTSFCARGTTPLPRDRRKPSVTTRRC
jgi:acyl-CoA synthetase (AMP-forming)/AMP-acid ligase II